MTTIFRPTNSAESNLYIIRVSFKTHTDGSGDIVLTGSTTYLEAPTSNNLPTDFTVTWDDSENHYIIRYGKTFTSTPNVYVNYKTTNTTYNNDDEYDEVLFPNVYYKDITSTTNAYITFRKMFSATGTADAGDKACAVNGFDLLIIGPVKLGQTTGQSNRGWSLGTDGSDTYTYLDVGVGTGNPQRILHSSIHDTTNNGVSYPLRLTHTTSGTPSTNIGTGIEFEIETSESNNEIGALIDVSMEDVNSTSEDSAMIFKTMSSGAAADEKLRVSQYGVIANETANTNYDFRVKSLNETHMLFVDSSSNRVSIGDSTDDPSATLEITNNATAGAYDVPLLQLNNNDVDQIALDINALNTTANVLDINADSLTTNNAINVSADALTTGSGLSVSSTSAAKTTGALVNIAQTGATTTQEEATLSVSTSATTHANAGIASFTGDAMTTGKG
jgi:hypothetical protein